MPKGYRHGYAPAGKQTSIYSIWCAIIQRCTNPNAKAFKDYGARGILPCERWLKFKNFIADILAEIGPRPPGMKGKRPLYTLERINNTKGYEPGNVRWATMKEQGANKRRYKTSLPLETVAAIKADPRPYNQIVVAYGTNLVTICRIKRDHR
jgi:hypothetical protein